MSEQDRTRKLAKPFIGMAGKLCLICGSYSGKCYDVEFRCDCPDSKYPTDMEADLEN